MGSGAGFIKDTIPGTITPMMPFIYLLSGGFKYNLTMPAFSYSFWRKVEHRLFNEEKRGMFGLIVLEKG